MEDNLLPLGNILSAEDLGALIRQKRKLSNLTQFELSALSFVGTRFVSELENGKPTLEIGKVLQVLQALGLTLKIQQAQEPKTETKIHIATESSQKPGYRLLTPVHLEQFREEQRTAIPVFKKENTLFLPQHGAESSHILKLPLMPFKSMVTNEFFCTLLARALNISAPQVHYPLQYENTLLLEPTPSPSKKELLERTIFNYLIGNFHQDNNNNMLCTLIYPDFKPSNPPTESKWEIFSQENQIKLKLIEEKLKEFSDKIVREMENVFEYIDNHFEMNIDVIPKICQIIIKRAST